MAYYRTLLVTYILGGITFIPLVVLVVFGLSYAFLPRSDPGLLSVRAESPTIEVDAGELQEKLFDRTHEPDVAAGYFAVCREYVPGGVNGKPPERTTPAGETIATESPSVYQSMYRSIFDRNKAQGPTIEGGKAVKKARNVFYVVLRSVAAMYMHDRHIGHLLISLQARAPTPLRQLRAT